MPWSWMSALGTALPAVRPGFVVCRELLGKAGRGKNPRGRPQDEGQDGGDWCCVLKGVYKGHGIGFLSTLVEDTPPCVWSISYYHDYLDTKV